jgi:parvulin-like peptidyl-prolyl isomerase
MKTTKKIVSALVLVTSILSAETLVTVNGTAITQTDVDSALMNATQGRFNQVPPEKQVEFRRQVLDQLVAKELIYTDAKKTGVLNSSEFKDEYQKVQEKVKKEIAVQIWQKNQLDKVSVSSSELKKYYDDNKAEFKEPESVRARHILVKTKEEAETLLKDLKLKGKALEQKFIELAKEKSVGPSGPKGGDLGYFAKGQMVPEFNDKAFSMKVGTVSEPVKTQFGYHLIYLEDKKDAKNLSFDEVKALLNKDLS